MVFYRKYRPQLISELDLESVRNRLTSILSSKDIPHAFLFSGPKGLGKTSSARILAKAINCEKRKVGEVEPCNVCGACISVSQGNAVDVLEIDAASNRGIDEIRDLRERIKFSPSNLKKKIYIIDEVHMLTTEAFNALLKTLEEPPSHVVFILATTEAGKLPSTIISRVFQVQFEKPSKEELARSLSRIVKGESLKLEESVIDKVSELSDGAFRDGAKILEELSLHSNGKKISLSLIDTLYKTGNIDRGVNELVRFGLEKKAKEALGVIQNLASVNADFKLVIEKMAEVLHEKLIETASEDKIDALEEINGFLKVLDEAYKDLKGAILPQLPLEIALIEYSFEKNEVESIQNKVQPPSSPIKNDVHPRGVHDGYGDILKDLIGRVNQENKILAGLLRGCSIEEISGELTLKAPSSFHAGKLGEGKNRGVIEKILGKSVAITIKNS